VKIESFVELCQDHMNRGMDLLLDLQEVALLQAQEPVDGLPVEELAHLYRTTLTQLRAEHAVLDAMTELFRQRSVFNPENAPEPVGS
jgi:hypothetical protein